MSHITISGSPLGIVSLSSARDKDGASSASSGVPGLPVLPPIGQSYTMLTPIGEASREHTQHTQALSLQQPLTDGKICSLFNHVWFEMIF